MHSELVACGQVEIKSCNLRAFKGTGKCDAARLNRLSTQILTKHLHQAAHQLAADDSTDGMPSESKDVSTVMALKSPAHVVESLAPHDVSSDPDIPASDATIRDPLLSNASSEANSCFENTPLRKRCSPVLELQSPVQNKIPRLDCVGVDRFPILDEASPPLACSLRVEWWKGCKIQEGKSKVGSQTQSVRLFLKAGRAKLETRGLADDLNVDIHDVRQILPSRDDPGRAVLVIETRWTATYLTILDAVPSHLRKFLQDVRDSFQ